VSTHCQSDVIAQFCDAMRAAGLIVKPRKLDRTLIGDFLLTLSGAVGDFNHRHIPASVERPDVLMRKVAIAEMRVRPSAQAISHFLMIDQAWRGVVWANTFAERIEARIDPPCGGGAGPWTDDHDTRLAAWLTGWHKVKEVSDRAVSKAVSLLAFADQRHPVRDYLRDLKWDGVPRLDTWLTTFAGVKDDTYTHNVGAKTLISMVARIMEPGTKVDTMPVLEGDQSIRKSSLIEALMRDAEWFADSLDSDLGNKDSAIGLQGKWAIEIPELAAFERTGPKAAKAFVSRKVDHYRSPFGINAKDHPRQCVFWGTVNPEGDGRYLTDSTGARRYWPLAMTALDLAGVKENRDQLWAEAFQRYGASEQWWLLSEVEVLAKVEQAARMEGNTWDVYVDQFMRLAPVRGDKNGLGWIERKAALTKVTTAEIFEVFTGRVPTRRDAPELRSICTALKVAGWTQVNSRAQGGRVWQREHPAGSDERDALL
jgi:predicted P-loop ATPase